MLGPGRCTSRHVRGESQRAIAARRCQCRLRACSLRRVGEHASRDAQVTVLLSVRTCRQPQSCERVVNSPLPRVQLA
jgi:hypothetical protein